MTSTVTLTSYVNVCRAADQRAQTITGNTSVAATVSQLDTWNDQRYVRGVGRRQRLAILHPLIDWAR